MKNKENEGPQDERTRIKRPSFPVLPPPSHPAGARLHKSKSTGNKFSNLACRISLIILPLVYLVHGLGPQRDKIKNLLVKTA